MKNMRIGNGEFLLQIRTRKLVSHLVSQVGSIEQVQQNHAISGTPGMRGFHQHTNKLAGREEIDTIDELTKLYIPILGEDAYINCKRLSSGGRRLYIVGVISSTKSGKGGSMRNMMTIYEKTRYIVYHELPPKHLPDTA